MENIVRSVQDVTKVQIDKQTNTLRMFCVSRGCNKPIVNKVMEDLKQNRYAVKVQRTVAEQQPYGVTAGGISTLIGGIKCPLFL